MGVLFTREHYAIFCSVCSRVRWVAAQISIGTGLCYNRIPGCFRKKHVGKKKLCKEIESTKSKEGNDRKSREHGPLDNRKQARVWRGSGQLNEVC